MKVHLSDNYRMIGRSLYRKRDNAFIHCAIVPVHIKSLTKAIEWFEAEA